MADLVFSNFSFGLCPITEVYEDTNVGAIFTKEFDFGAVTNDDIYIYIDIEDKSGTTNSITIRVNQVTSSSYTTTRLTGATLSDPTSSSFYGFSLAANKKGSALFVVRSNGTPCSIGLIHKMNDNTQPYMLAGSESTISGGIRWVHVFTSGNAIGKFLIGRVDASVYTVN